jgi:hypothetical protein
MLTKRPHNGGNVQRKFQEILMTANSQTTIFFLQTRNNGMMDNDLHKNISQDFKIFWKSV